MTDEKAEDGYVLPPARGGVRSHGLAASAGADRRGGNQEQADATAEITSQTPTHYIHLYIHTVHMHTRKSTSHIHTYTHIDLNVS